MYISKFGKTLCLTIVKISSYVHISSHYQKFGNIFKYRRSGFLIANGEFFHNSQSKELQLKEYAMNNITRNHTPCACQALDQLSARAFLHVFLLSHANNLTIEIEMSLCQYFKPTVILPTSSFRQYKGP